MPYGNALRLLAGAAVVALSVGSAARAQVILSGNDEKVTWDDKGAVVIHEAGHDSVTILSIANPAAPKIIANLSMENSVFGPPTNLAVVPGGQIALAANSLHGVQDGGVWKQVPDNHVYVIDLTTSPPKQIASIEVGKQPSGMSVTPKGDLALVANRADNSVSVLAISGKTVTLIGSVPVGETTPGVTITPDGKHALVLKNTTHHIGILAIDGQKVTATGADIAAGLWPYNVAVAPNGKLALVADQGPGGASNGSVDTVAVIDLEAKPPRTIDYVAVGETPEGLEISPKGDLAVAVLVQGTNADKSASFYHPKSAVVTLRIDGKKVTRLKELPVGPIAEGVGFSPDGRYLYVSSGPDETLEVFAVHGLQVTPTGTKVKLPGHPVSMAVTPAK